MITIVWQPVDAPSEETLTWAEGSRAEFDTLLANWRAADPNGVLAIPTRVTPDGPLTDRIFRAGRVRDIRWDD